MTPDRLKQLETALRPDQSGMTAGWSHQVCVAVLAELKRLTEERDALVAALGTYGGHSIGGNGSDPCAKWDFGSREDTLCLWAKCTCGWKATVDPLANLTALIARERKIGAAEECERLAAAHREMAETTFPSYHMRKADELIERAAQLRGEAGER